MKRTKGVEGLLLDARHHSTAREDVIQRDAIPPMAGTFFFLLANRHCGMIPGISKSFFLVGEATVRAAPLCFISQPAGKPSPGCPWPALLPLPVLPVCVWHVCLCPWHEKMERQQHQHQHGRLAKRQQRAVASRTSPSSASPSLAYNTPRSLYAHIPEASSKPSARQESPERQGDGGGGFF